MHTRFPRLRHGLLACLAAPLFLTACGGGGFEAPPSAESQSAEGAWVGTLNGSSRGDSAHVLVLENGEFWVAYGVENGTLAITGFVQGTGTSDKGVFSSANARDFASSAPADVQLDGTYVRNSRMVGNLATGVGFVGVPWALTVTDTSGEAVYDYDTKASAADVAGQWVVSASDGLDYSIAISSGAGSLTGYARGCLLNGKLTPRLTHKNVFDLSVTFGAAPCADPGGSYRGVVYLEPKKLSFGTTEDEGFQVIGMSVNSDRTKGFAFSAAYKADRSLGVTVPVDFR